MTDKDLVKLLSKLTGSLATKEDVISVREDVSSVREDIKGVEVRLGKKLNELNIKADTIMEFAEEVEKITSNHEKRLKRIETIPVIAHQIKS